MVEQRLSVAASQNVKSQLMPGIDCDQQTSYMRPIPLLIFKTVQVFSQISQQLNLHTNSETRWNTSRNGLWTKCITENFFSHTKENWHRHRLLCYCTPYITLYVSVNKSCSCVDNYGHLTLSRLPKHCPLTFLFAEISLRRIRFFCIF